MANKREFKKYVSAVGASMCEDIMICYYNIPDIDHKAANEAVGKILGAMNEATKRSNVFFDKGKRAFESDEAYSKAKKAFFRAVFAKIAGDFRKDLEEAVKQFNAAIPQAVKEKNKEIANA